MAGVHALIGLAGGRLNCCIRLLAAGTCAPGTDACACMAAWLDMPCMYKSGGVDRVSVSLPAR